MVPKVRIIRSVAIVIRFVGTLNGNVEVACLFGREHSKLGTDVLKMQSSDFFVEMLWEHMDSDGVILFPQRDLGENLVGEAGAHDKAGMTCGTPEVYARAKSIKTNRCTP